MKTIDPAHAYTTEEVEDMFNVCIDDIIVDSDEMGRVGFLAVISGKKKQDVYSINETNVDSNHWYIEVEDILEVLNGEV